MTPSPVVVLAVGGPIAVAIVWLLVRAEKVSIWVGMGSVVGILGVLSLLTGGVEAASEVAMALAVVVGAGAGVALYGATWAFLSVVGGWPPLAEQTASLYDRRGEISLGAALGISALLTAFGEELLWRGVVQDSLTSAFDAAAAAALAWAAYVAVNAVSGSLPIVLGAAVGGAAWTGLALWTGGVAASMVCHAVWTAMMLVLPPIRERSA